MTHNLIDLRSDTVTKPSAGMREAMTRAIVGDDVYGEDPTVNMLQEKVALMLGKPAALYVPSGTMGNQICLKVHTEPGDEVIAEKGCHIFNYETGAAPFLSSIQLHTIEGIRGVITPEQIKRSIRPKAYYMSRTSLIEIENTHNRAGGTIYPLETIKEIHALAKAEGIGLHLDGARLWNASAATGISPKEYASYFDSVSVCLSKGLGAPVGSVIAGSLEFVAKARRYRKIFGGGMRQAGVLAAAGIYALENNIERLGDDHKKARLLANELSKNAALSIDIESVQTNIIIMSLERSGKQPDEILSALKSQGIMLSAGNYMGLRAVTHMDVSMEDVERAATVIMDVLKN